MYLIDIQRKKLEISKRARAKVDGGMSKLDTFAHLYQNADLPIKQLTKVIQLTPTPQARNKYRNLNCFLMVVFAVTVVLKMAYISTITVSLPVKYFSYVRPVIGIFILIGIDKFLLGCQRVAAIYTFTGTITTFVRLAENNTSLLMYAYLLSAIVTIVLGLFLSSKLYPKFTTEEEIQLKETQTKQPTFINN